MVLAIIAAENANLVPAQAAIAFAGSHAAGHPKCTVLVAHNGRCARPPFGFVAIGFKYGDARCVELI